MISKLAVIGTGLIGGSLALALKRAGVVQTVVGIGRSQQNLDTAQRLGIADRTVTLDGNWTDELADADLVLLATPVGQMAHLFSTMSPHLGRTTIITDAGSTKQDVIAAARAHLGSAIARFVPGHPIAGSERSGADAASASLFHDKVVVLTPLAETDAEALSSVRACWQQCGAIIRVLDAKRHDEIFSAVSHLPHTLAFALIAELAERQDARELFDFAGAGLRDFSRLAGSHPEMWRDICLANAVALRRDLAAYRQKLDRIDALLASGDATGLTSLFTAAHDARIAWIASVSVVDSGK